MELVKNKLSTTIMKTSKYTQFTINDDFNVPDAKNDMEKIIACTGNVLLMDIDTLENKVRISGTVVFKLLYQTEGDGEKIESYEGDVPFEEAVNMEGIAPGDKVDVNCILEDLYITMINSRKFEVRGLVGMKIAAMEQVALEGATSIMNGSGIECLCENVPFTNNVANVKDIFRIKEDIEIPASKPNIGRVLWDQVSFCSLESRVTDGAVTITGNIELFVIYKADDDSGQLWYINETRAFEGSVPVDDVQEGMILDDNISVGKGQVSVKADADGEDRVFQVDYNLNIDMKIYEDMEMTIMSDMFSPSVDVETIRQTFPYDNLQMKNNAKTKVAHREKLKSSQPHILQIAHSCGTVDLDDVKLSDDTIIISGAVKANILYISADDNRPVNQVEFVIPFTYQMEVPNLSDRTSVRINPYIDQIATQMMSGDEMEVKAMVSMNMTVFNRENIDVITDMEIKPIDWNKKAAMPGIVGYVVREGDSIWSIAKAYFSTPGSIREINGLTTDSITPGDRLIVVKS